MKVIAGALIIVAALAFGSGCARTDWIERTLVTVDVTGTWYGSVGGAEDLGASVSGSSWSNRDQRSRGLCKVT